MGLTLVTLSSSGSTITAPGGGWILVYCRATAAFAFFEMRTGALSISHGNAALNQTIFLYLPVVTATGVVVTYKDVKDVTMTFVTPIGKQ